VYYSYHYIPRYSYGRSAVALLSPFERTRLVAYIEVNSSRRLSTIPSKLLLFVLSPSPLAIFFVCFVYILRHILHPSLLHHGHGWGPLGQGWRYIEFPMPRTLAGSVLD
jgi:hypothetical protein